MGEIASTRLGESGVDLSHITSREDAGTSVTVLLPHGGRRHILTYLGAMAEMTVAIWISPTSPPHVVCISPHFSCRQIRAVYTRKTAGVRFFPMERELPTVARGESRAP